jgi:hypothetical protein
MGSFDIFLKSLIIINFFVNSYTFQDWIKFLNL